jgi:hypothetical protein
MSPIDPTNKGFSDIIPLFSNIDKDKLAAKIKEVEKDLSEKPSVEVLNNLYLEREQASQSAEAIAQARENPEFAQAIFNEVWHSLSNTNDNRFEAIIKELKRIAEKAVEDSKFLTALNRDLDGLNII